MCNYGFTCHLHAVCVILDHSLIYHTYIYILCVCVYFFHTLHCYAMLCFVAILQAHGFCPSQKQRICSHTHTQSVHSPWYGCRITVRITIKFAFITFKCSNKLFGRALVRLISVAPSAELGSMVLFFLLLS